MYKNVQNNETLDADRLWIKTMHEAQSDRGNPEESTKKMEKINKV
jgi:hypothetical protein